MSKDKCFSEEKIYNKAIQILRKRILDSNNIDSKITLKNKDFIYLENDIFNKTNVKISGSTLRRIWGAIHTESKAKEQTLLILSQYAGFKNWYQLKKIAKRKLNFDFFKVKLSPYLLGVAIITTLAIYAINNIKPKIETNYTINTDTYPTTFKLEYNIIKLLRDNLALKFNFEKEKIKLYKDRNTVIKLIFMGGYIDAKILYNNNIIENKKFFVNTNGWKCIEVAENNKYLLRDNIIKDGYLINLPGNKQSKKKPKLIYYNDLKIDTNHFTLETAFKLKFKQNGELHKANIGIDFEKSWIDFGFADKMNISKSHVVIGSKTLPGLYNDHTKMAIEANKEHKIKIIKNHETLRLVINDIDTLLFNYSENIGRFEGLDFSSFDTLKLDYVHLYSGDEKIYSTDFNY